MTKPLIIALIALSIIFILWFFLNSNESTLRRPLNTTNQPTIGNPEAPVQVVVFEEPKCPGCKQFTLQIYPKIREEFIDTDLVIYSVIPVSFLPNSMLAAEAWLCVHHQNSSSEVPISFQYIEQMYVNQPPESENWVNKKYLSQLAEKQTPSVSIESLEKCLENNTYRKQVEKNTLYCMKLLKGKLSTPALFIDGKFVSKLNYVTIQSMINETLANQNSLKNKEE